MNRKLTLSHASKSGFTLIELLIVTVVVVSLMAIVFRLTGIAGSASKQERTIARMQRLENCLSGYYAVFGSYPPVPLQGASRDIYRKAMGNGVQSDSETESRLVWNNVKAACLAQPVKVLYPVANKKPGSTKDGFEEYTTFQADVMELYNSGAYTKSVMDAVDGWKDATLVNLNESAGHIGSGYKKETSFGTLQLFRYGLMSFLLPRYKFMLDCARGDDSKYKSGGFVPWEYAQWLKYNPLPSKMNSGTQFKSWREFCQELYGKDEWQIELIPSQAACARWMPNLLKTADDSDIVHGAKVTAFGMEVGNNRVCPSPAYPSGFNLYSTGGYKEGGSSSGYPLYHITMQDGWENDLYYYSPAPYQMYVLWSSGADGKTVPPWVDIRELSSDDYKTAVKWMSDDIKSMKTGK
jgi:prepilin-type N-terminal cleavage/methylation domain-containing protein